MTRSATALGLTWTFYLAPYLIVSPFAGAMVDRYNRKLMMILSDLGAGLATVTWRAGWKRVAALLQHSGQVRQRTYSTAAAMSYGYSA